MLSRIKFYKHFYSYVKFMLVLYHIKISTIFMLNFLYEEYRKVYPHKKFCKEPCDIIFIDRFFHRFICDYTGVDYICFD